MPSTTADRIRKCADVAEHLANDFWDAYRFSEFTDGVKESRDTVMRRLQELWDTAYQAGRSNASTD